MAWAWSPWKDGSPVPLQESDVRDEVVDQLRKLAGAHGLTPTQNALELETNRVLAMATALRADPVRTVKRLRTQPPPDQAEVQATINRLSKGTA